MCDNAYNLTLRDLVIGLCLAALFNVGVKIIPT